MNVASPPWASGQQAGRWTPTTLQRCTDLSPSAPLHSTQERHLCGGRPGSLEIFLTKIFPLPILLLITSRTGLPCWWTLDVVGIKVAGSCWRTVEPLCATNSNIRCVSNRSRLRLVASRFLNSTRCALHNPPLWPCAHCQHRSLPTANLDVLAIPRDYFSSTMTRHSFGRRYRSSRAETLILGFRWSSTACDPMKFCATPIQQCTTWCICASHSRHDATFESIPCAWLVRDQSHE